MCGKRAEPILGRMEKRAEKSEPAPLKVLFVASDLLIFAQMGVLAQSPLPGLLIWPLYYFGQFLICIGVVGELRRRAAA